MTSDETKNSARNKKCPEHGNKPVAITYGDEIQVNGQVPKTKAIITFSCGCTYTYDFIPLLEQ